MTTITPEDVWEADLGTGALMSTADDLAARAGAVSTAVEQAVSTYWAGINYDTYSGVKESTVWSAITPARTRGDDYVSDIYGLSEATLTLAAEIDSIANAGSVLRDEVRQWWAWTNPYADKNSPLPFGQPVFDPDKFAQWKRCQIAHDPEMTGDDGYSARHEQLVRRFATAIHAFADIVSSPTVEPPVPQNPWYEKVLNGVGGFAIGLGGSSIVDTLIGLMHGEDWIYNNFVFGPMYLASGGSTPLPQMQMGNVAQSRWDEKKRYIEENWVTDDQWYSRGETLGDVFGLVAGIAMMATGAGEIKAGAAAVGAGYEVVGVGRGAVALVGAAEASISYVQVVAGALELGTGLLMMAAGAKNGLNGVSQAAGGKQSPPKYKKYFRWTPETPPSKSIRSKPEGAPLAPSATATEEEQKLLNAENGIVERLADGGYKVRYPAEDLKITLGKDRTKRFSYSSSAGMTPENLWRKLASMAQEEKKDYILIECNDGPLDPVNARKALLKLRPIPGVKEVIAVKGSAVIQIYPR